MTYCLKLYLSRLVYESKYSKSLKYIEIYIIFSKICSADFVLYHKSVICKIEIAINNINVIITENSAERSQFCKEVSNLRTIISIIFIKKNDFLN